MEIMIQLYNTLTRTKEPLPQPLHGKLRIFVCGPTVYDYPQIGNARTYLIFDAFVRYLRFSKIPVFYLQNITDIDDKIIARAREQHVSPNAMARRFERVYHQYERMLGITSVDAYARATDYIPQIIAQVQTLIRKGHAYTINGDGYYFDLTTFPAYGKLSHRTTAQAEDATSRIDEGIHKRNAGDFVLWKLLPQSHIPKRITRKKFIVIDGEPAWNTALGWGRPGWHIEDTAITESFFGPQYELHGGGLDLIFPHHEAEITQQESASGKTPLVKLWMHSGLLLVNGQKMSKSRGNFITVNEILKTYDAQTFRYLILSHHYRAPMDYTPSLATRSHAALQTLLSFLAMLDFIALRGTSKTSPQHLARYLTAFSTEFFGSLDDDFNTPRALAATFTLVNTIQPILFSLTKSDAKHLRQQFIQLIGVLGFTLTPPPIPLRIKKLIDMRDVLRNKKDFAASDALRERITALGYTIEDTPIGTLALKTSNS